MYPNRKNLTMLTVVSAVCSTLIVRDLVPRRSQIYLMTSIQSGSLSGVKRALALGADPNGVTGNSTVTIACPGQTATTYAVWEGSPKIVEALINAGGLVNSQDPIGNTPLIVAITGRNVAMCSMLLRLGADPFKTGRNPFDKSMIITPMDALASQSVGRTSELIATNQSPQAKKDIDGMYQLLRASRDMPTLVQAESRYRSRILAVRCPAPHAVIVD